MMSSNPSLSLTSSLGTLFFALMSHIHLTILISLSAEVPRHFRFLQIIIGLQLFVILHCTFHFHVKQMALKWKNTKRVL